MIRIFYTFLGEYATAVIQFYRDNQVWLNAVVVVYGILLALAHRNVVRLEYWLRERTGSNDMVAIRQRIEEGESGLLDIDELRKELRVPLLASPYHLTFFSLSEKSILRILRKKYPRSRTT